jgi:glucose/arabinose dehydrogenase
MTHSKWRFVLSIAWAGLCLILTSAVVAQDEKKDEAKKDDPPAAEKKDDAEKKDTEKKDAEKKDAEKKDAEKKDAEKKDAEKKDEDTKDADKKDEEKKDEAKPAEATGPKAKAAVIHLDNPSGVCVHPDTKQVFAVSHQGVFRYLPDKRKIFLEVDGFPTDEYGKGPVYQIGPLGCTLWGKDRLIVGDGSRKDGEELVRIYKIEEAPPADKPRKEDAAEFTLGPIAPSDLSKMGEGNFYGPVVWNNALYVSSNGDDTKGWILKAALEGEKPGELTPSIATKEATEVDAPIGITVSPDGSNLVVGQGGEVNVAGDSLLTTYDAEGKLVKKYATGLNDIVGLAYSPKSSKLYVVDFSWVKPEDGGLFELVIEGEEAKPTKVMALDRPTALAFDPDGALYITVFGGMDKFYTPPAGTDPTKEEGKPKGGMIRLEPGL